MSRVFCAYSLCIALMFCAAAVMFICIFFHHVCEISNWLEIQINSSVIVYGHLFIAVETDTLHFGISSPGNTSSFRNIGNRNRPSSVVAVDYVGNARNSPGSTYI